jgi:transposase
MPRAYHPDLRHRVIHAVEHNTPIQDIVRLLNISPSTIERYVKRHRATGSLQPGKSTGRKRRLTADQEQALGTQCDTHPDDTLEQHAQRLLEEHHVQVSASTVSRALTRLKRTRKKDTSRR